MAGRTKSAPARLDDELLRAEKIIGVLDATRKGWDVKLTVSLSFRKDGKVYHIISGSNRWFSVATWRNHSLNAWVLLLQATGWEVNRTKLDATRDETHKGRHG
jgi:hypothetical protein